MRDVFINHHIRLRLIVGLIIRLLVYDIRFNRRIAVNTAPFCIIKKEKVWNAHKNVKSQFLIYYLSLTFCIWRQHWVSFVVVFCRCPWAKTTKKWTLIDAWDIWADRSSIFLFCNGYIYTVSLYNEPGATVFTKFLFLNE